MSEKRKATIYDMRRYCKAHFVKGSCKDCLFYNDGYCRLIRSCFGEVSKNDIEFINKTILEWCDSHPVKTYFDCFKDYLKKKYPKSKEDFDLVINNICRARMCGQLVSDGGCPNPEISCTDCWNSPMAEEE